MTDTYELSNSQRSGGLLLDQPQFLTVQQASKLLRVSTWALYQVIRTGELPVIRGGRRVVLQREDLAAFLASKRDEGMSRARRFSLRPMDSTAPQPMKATTSVGLYGRVSTDHSRPGSA